MMESTDLTNRSERGSAQPSLSDREREVLGVVVRYVSGTGEPCPGRYIARQLGMHHSTIQQHLERLHRRGWLRGPNAPAFPTRTT